MAWEGEVVAQCYQVTFLNETFDELHCSQSAPGQRGKSLSYCTHLLVKETSSLVVLISLHFTLCTPKVTDCFAASKLETFKDCRIG